VHVDASTRPVCTVRELQTLRDRVVHARPEAINKTFSHAVGKLPLFHNVALIDMLTKQKTALFVKDGRALTERIHADAQRKAHSPWLGTPPFGGITMHVSGHTELMPVPAGEDQDA
jgi:hypothetical protein